MNANRLDRTGAVFPATKWPPGENLEELCHLYWPPIYAFLRRGGKTPEEAKDLTQGFFVHMLQRERLKAVSPEKGRFRTYLLQCLKHFVGNEWKKEHALSRGGAVQFVPLDAPEVEHFIDSGWTNSETPEGAYDRQWALTWISNVIKRLHAEYARAGKVERFEALYHFLADENERGDYEKLAALLNITPGAARKAAHDLRKRFKEIRRLELERTAVAGEVEQELRYLSGTSRRKS